MLRLLRTARPWWDVAQHSRLSTSAVLLKGHSKWQNIKETKGKNDAARSAKISFLLRKVRTAVKHGGFDPKFNKALSNLVQDYRALNLPMDTLNRYLQRIKVGLPGACVQPGLGKARGHRLLRPDRAVGLLLHRGGRDGQREPDEELTSEVH